MRRKKLSCACGWGRPQLFDVETKGRRRKNPHLCGSMGRWLLTCLSGLVSQGTAQGEGMNLIYRPSPVVMILLFSAYCVQSWCTVCGVAVQGHSVCN